MVLAERLLLLDVGNSRIKGQILGGMRLLGSFELATKHPWNGEKLFTALASQWEKLGPTPQSVCVCSVVEGLVVYLNQAFKQAGIQDILFLDEQVLSPLGLQNEAQGCGNDRLVTAFGSWLNYREDLVILDFGTATTYDVITGSGKFLGGMILPGVRLSFEALASQAEGLREVDLEEMPPLIGKNTADALRSGIILGNAMMADRFKEKIALEQGRPFRMIATGGLGRFIAPSSNAIEGWIEDLTMQSMARIWKAHRAEETQGGRHG